jgi:hypothetical protein
MAVTTWNTVPDYDEWGRDTYWNADDWITWHKLLKQHFGQDRANIIWNYAYAQGSAFQRITTTELLIAILEVMPSLKTLIHMQALVYH